MLGLFKYLDLYINLFSCTRRVYKIGCFLSHIIIMRCTRKITYFQTFSITLNDVCEAQLYFNKRHRFAIPWAQFCIYKTYFTLLSSHAPYQTRLYKWYTFHLTYGKKSWESRPVSTRIMRPTCPPQSPFSIFQTMPSLHSRHHNLSTQVTKKDKLSPYLCPHSGQSGTLVWPSWSKYLTQHKQAVKWLLFSRPQLLPDFLFSKHFHVACFPSVCLGCEGRK